MTSTSHKYPPCPSVPYPTPSCEKKCEGSKIHYSEDLIRGSLAYILTGVQTIQRDILKNGPLETSFDVYSDFPHYKSGNFRLYLIPQLSCVTGIELSYKIINNGLQ